MKPMKKNLLVLISALCLAGALPAQDEKKVKCKDIKASIIKGDVNGLTTESSMADVKKALPCFTGEGEEGGTANCGGGVFYRENEIYFYTSKDYIEIRSGFLGKLDTPLFGRDIRQANDYFTKPVKTEEKSSGTYHYYKQKYGTLIIRTNDDAIDLVQLWKSKWDEVVLCE